MQYTLARSLQSRLRLQLREGTIIDFTFYLNYRLLLVSSLLLPSPINGRAGLERHTVGDCSHDGRG